MELLWLLHLLCSPTRKLRWFSVFRSTPVTAIPRLSSKKLFPTNSLPLWFSFYMCIQQFFVYVICIFQVLCICKYCSICLVSSVTGSCVHPGEKGSGSNILFLLVPAWFGTPKKKIIMFKMIRHILWVNFNILMEVFFTDYHCFVDCWIRGSNGNSVCGEIWEQPHRLDGDLWPFWQILQQSNSYFNSGFIGLCCIFNPHSHLCQEIKKNPGLIGRDEENPRKRCLFRFINFICMLHVKEYVVFVGNFLPRYIYDLVEAN